MITRRELMTMAVSMGAGVAIGIGAQPDPRGGLKVALGGQLSRENRAALAAADHDMAVFGTGMIEITTVAGTSDCVTVKHVPIQERASDE